MHYGSGTVDTCLAVSWRMLLHMQHPYSSVLRLIGQVILLGQLSLSSLGDR